MTFSCLSPNEDVSSLVGPLGIDYASIYYCEMDGNRFYQYSFLFLLFLWVLFLMNLLANTAANYFSPTLSTICDKLNIAYDIAGVTLLAFGNGAPDFFSLVASFSGEADVLIGLGALLGGSVFVCTIVVGSIAILCPCDASKPVFLRDVAFHLIATNCVVILAFLGDITLVYAISFVLIYVTYVLYVTMASLCKPKLNAAMEKATETPSGDIPLLSIHQPNEGIQFAFWHRNDTKSRQKSQGKYSTVLMEEKEPIDETPSTGYTFLILSENNMKETGNKSSGEEDQIINFTGGYVPPFNNIIDEDYCALPASQDMELSCDSIGSSNASDSLEEFERNTLQRSLLSSARNRKTNQYKQQGKSAYDNVVMSLYWRQWALQRRFHRHLMLSDWWSYPIQQKIFFIFEYPVVLARDLTIPTLDDDNWSRSYALLHPLLSPLLIIFLFGGIREQVGELPLPLVCVLVGLIPSATIFVLTHKSKAPQNKTFVTIWSLWAFVMCIFWTYALAGELIIALSAIGVFLQLPPSFLGLTILAWGNSVGDFFTNTSVARQGYGEMAIAGCYGGPIFNILMGLGVSLIYCAFNSYPNSFQVHLDASSKLSLLFLEIILLSTIVFVWVQKFHIGRTFGIYLIVLYGLYTLSQALLLVINK